MQNYQNRICIVDNLVVKLAICNNKCLKNKKNKHFLGILGIFYGHKRQAEANITKSEIFCF